MVVPLEWLNLMVAEPKRGDERADGFTLKFEGALTVALVMAEWMAPVTPLLASMAPIASLASMVASMALLVVLLASMASMVASLDRLRFMIESKICEERADGLTHKICEERDYELTIKIDGERVGRLAHIIRAERVDGLTFKIAEERADGWSAKTGEERADGWTCRKVVAQMLVNGDGSEGGRIRWTKTRATSCLRRTQKKFESSSTLGCVRCEKSWLRMAQVTPSTELQECAFRKSTVASMVVASMASMVAWVASMAPYGGVEWW